MQQPFENALVVAVVFVNAYCFGANCVERFVNYQTWSLVPADAFRAYHRAQQPLIQATIVAPMALGFVLQLCLAFRVPVGVDPRTIWVMVIASAAGALSTLILQLPIHAAFNTGSYSPERLRTLLRTDWLRKAADVVRLAATAGLLYQMLNAR